MLSVRLEPHTLHLDQELAQLSTADGSVGAIVSFVGVARSAANDGSRVDGLYLEHHSTLTQSSMEQIAQDAAQRFALSGVHIVHRCGFVAAGEPIVFAGAAARHRRAAFEGADYMMDRLKTEAVFWKKEEGPSGSSWIEPTLRDVQDRDRWTCMASTKA